MQDEGHAHVAGRLVVVDQKVRAQVDGAFFFVEAGGLFQVLVDDVAGDDEAEAGGDPAFFFRRGVFEVDPDRARRRQLVEAVDFFLEQAAIGQREDVEHRDSST